MYDIGSEVRRALIGKLPGETHSLINSAFPLQYAEGTNVLGMVMFSVILGATIGKLKEKGKPLQAFFVALSEAMMTITSWVIW